MDSQICINVGNVSVFRKEIANSHLKSRQPSISKMRLGDIKYCHQTYWMVSRPKWGAIGPAGLEVDGEVAMK